jgi:hypothetical protein
MWCYMEEEGAEGSSPAANHGSRSADAGWWWREASVAGGVHRQEVLSREEGRWSGIVFSGRWLRSWAPFIWLGAARRGDREAVAGGDWSFDVLF